MRRISRIVVKILMIEIISAIHIVNVNGIMGNSHPPIKLKNLIKNKCEEKKRKLKLHHHNA